MQHRLKPNINNEFPSHFIFYDTETLQHSIGKNEIEHNLRLGVALYWERRSERENDTMVWKDFTSPGEFWDFALQYARDKTRLVIISHNLGFDMGIVKGFAELDRRGFETLKIIMDSRRNIWKFRKGNATLLFLDNMNYFNLSLATLGDSIGYPKMRMPDIKASDDEWQPYCRRDVEVLYEAWRQWYTFLSTNNLGNFGVTIASQAFNAFKHRFMTYPIVVHTSSKAIRLERDSYRGGRNECFRIREMPDAKYTMVDVNSMYPYVMMKNDYPCNIRYTGRSLHLDMLSKYLDEYCVIAEAIVKTPEPCFGVKKNNKLLFPIGCFKASLTTNELKYGLDRGYLKQIFNFACYDKAPIFNNYVDFFYTTRKKFMREGNISYNFLCKLFLNSLYGKFGQKVEEWKYVGDDPSRLYDYWTEWDVAKQMVFTYRCINHRVEELKGFREGFNSFVAIAAEVTANARMELWRLINLSGRHNVLYCDTDSLIVTEEGLHNLYDLIHPDNLGMLKKEKSDNSLVIYNLKDYEFGGERKIKGIRKNAVKLTETSYQQFQSVGLRAGLHRKDLNRVIWKEVVKELSRKYGKGIITADGSVKPLILDIYRGNNILSFSQMIDAYGANAVFDDQELLPETTGRYLDPMMRSSREADMSLSDRSLLDNEKLDKRRDGEMIYQRG